MSPSSVAKGGKAVYGAAVGILMLEARFPRIPGDVGNATTWPFPVLYKVVRGASPDRVVRRRAEGLLEAFVAGGRELVAEGADGLVTICGFLSLFQADLAAACGVPVATSALKAGPGDRTAAAARQTGRHPDRLRGQPGAGAPGCGWRRPRHAGRRHRGRAFFSRVLLGDELELDVAAAERDILDAGDALVARHPEVGAVLLECTNMCPYACALRDRLGLPAFDMVGFVTWFHGALVPRRWPAG